MIYVNCLDITEVNQELFEKFYAMASAERKQRADRYSCREDAGRCILAEALLRFSLQEAYGYCPEIDVRYNEYGKPFIKGLENFKYNLSHSGKWVVVGYHVAGINNVGIDVEKIREVGSCEKLAKRFFAQEEQEYIFSALDEKEKAGRFTEVWTLKESYVKYLGSGLSKSLESFSVDGATGCVRETSGKVIKGVRARSYALGEDYYLSVCSSGREVTIKRIHMQELSGLLKDERLQEASSKS